MSMSMNDPLLWQARQNGMSLVEVLVALVVLSVGMLGIAGLYVEEMRANRTALTRTQAVSLANDMADRIRANPRGGIDYEGPATLHACVAGVQCSSQELAQDDVARWRTTVAATLPNASVPVIDFTPAVGLGRPDRYDIVVSWIEPGEAAAFTYRVNMQLIPVAP
jgi:type IV pilus assembly protein PilV